MESQFSKKISVGIPTYNRPHSLKKKLDALLKQTYLNLEIIVSDNCSPDKNVKKIIDEFCKKDPRIVSCFQEKNIGLVNNFHFVLNKSTGSFFMWMADDDLIEDNDFIKKLFDSLILHNSDFVFPECYYLNKDGSRTSGLKNVYTSCSSKFDYLKAFTTSYSCLEFYGLYNMSAFNKEKDFIINDVVVCPDLLYIPNLLLNHKVRFVPETYFIYNHVSSADTFQRNLNLFRDRQIVIKELIAEFSATEKLRPEERKVIVTNILTHYEFILKQQLSIPKLKSVRIKFFNKIKLIMGIGKG